MTTKVQKWGNSLGIRIPKNLTRNLNITIGTSLNFQQQGNAIIITTSRPKYTLEDMVAAMKPKNRHPEYDWGEPMGKEVW